MSRLEDLEDLIRDKIEKEKITHARLSAFLQDQYPGEKGFSTRSLERFCSLKGIHKTSRLSDQELDTAVDEHITKVSYWPIYRMIFCKLGAVSKFS